ncbi:MAG TPA: protein kinase [Polyangiaceae bacterium]
MTLSPGQILDNKYRIVRLIGEGGMGSVHEGENTLIARRVAIKVLHQAATTNEQVLLRFEREAQAAGRIGSDHILEVLDMGRLPDGDRYMVMEYLDGEPLSARIERLVRMTPGQIAPLMRQALKGLQAAHDAGIIHRDLKPDNIFVLREKAGQPDFVKIIDFGISKFSALGNDMNMTRTGAVMGTPYYMSPEQAKGSSQVDPRSDVYAIGVIMYEAVTGRVPFDGNTFNELMFKIVLSDPPKLSEAVPELDPAFAAIINKAMARELEARFASAKELRQALDDYLGGVRASQVELPAGAVDHGAAMAAPGAPSTVGAKSETGATWANTNAEVTLPKRSAAPLVAAAVLGGLLVIGGGAFAALKLMGGESETAGGSALASAPTNIASAEPPAPEPAAKPAPAVAPQAPPPAPTVAASAPAPAESAAPAAETPKPVTPRAAPAKPVQRPSAAVKPAPAPVTKPKAKATDFGY